MDETIPAPAIDTKETLAEREHYDYVSTLFGMLMGARRLPPPARVPYPIFEAE